MQPITDEVQKRFCTHRFSIDDIEGNNYCCKIAIQDIGLL